MSLKDPDESHGRMNCSEQGSNGGPEYPYQAVAPPDTVCPKYDELEFGNQEPLPSPPDTGIIPPENGITSHPENGNPYSIKENFKDPGNELKNKPEEAGDMEDEGCPLLKEKQGQTFSDPNTSRGEYRPGNIFSDDLENNFSESIHRNEFTPNTLDRTYVSDQREPADELRNGTLSSGTDLISLEPGNSNKKYLFAFAKQEFFVNTMLQSKLL